MYPKIYGSMVLTGFEGGPLKVFLCDQWSDHSVTVTLPGPGDVEVSSDVMIGPKEWSPLSLAPKHAVPLFHRNSRSSFIRVVAKYESRGGRYETEMVVGIPPMTPDSTTTKDFCVYFVPTL